MQEHITDVVSTHVVMGRGVAAGVGEEAFRGEVGCVGGTIGVT